MYTWKKSSFSSGGDNCVEVAEAGSEIAIRDSNNPDVVVTTSAVDWAKFLDGVKAGEFDK